MSRSRGSFMAFATTLLVSVAAPFSADVRAQDVLLDVKCPVGGADGRWGIAIGDWDGDGTADLAIGAPDDWSNAPDAGAARVHSGTNGSVLATFYGAAWDDNFGSALARMPDLDGDGIDDLAVAAPYADNGGLDTGSVYLYAGRTGAFLCRADGRVTSSGGKPSGSLGDVDGDGVADLYFGHFGQHDEVDFYSGADGHWIAVVTGKGGEEFGWAASAIDDLDGDGVQELLVGAKSHVNSARLQVGAAYVVSPATGAVLRTHEGTFANEDLGFGTAALADLDGDGVHDYAVSALLDDSGYGSKVVVFSGASGAQLGKIASASTHEQITTGVAAAGDVNGDGVGDLVINGLWYDSKKNGLGAAFLVSGKTFLALDRIETPDVNIVVAPFGDLNGDGFDDVLVGSDDHTIDGEVRIYSGDDLWLEGTPSEARSGQLVELNTREGPPGTLTILVVEAIDGAPTFLVLGGVRSFGSLGGNKLYGKMPPGLSGHDFTLRAYANGPAGNVIASATQTITCK